MVQALSVLSTLTRPVPTLTRPVPSRTHIASFPRKNLASVPAKGRKVRDSGRKGTGCRKTSLLTRRCVGLD